MALIFKRRMTLVKKDKKMLLMRLMKTMNLNSRFIAEVATFLNKEEEQVAMILYLKANLNATEEQIMEKATDIMLADRLL